MRSTNQDAEMKDVDEVEGQRDGGMGGGVFQRAVMSVIKKWLDR